MGFPGHKNTRWGSLGSDRLTLAWRCPLQVPNAQKLEATRPSCTHRDVGLFTPRLLGVSLATVESDRVDWE